MGLAAIAGCQAPVDPVLSTKASTTPKVSAARSPSPAVSPPAVVKPGASPTAAVIPSPPAPTAVRPAAGSVPFRGTLRLDASYAASAGVGRLISNNGSTVLAATGNPLIADVGLGMLANNGSNLIANNGSGVLANNGARYGLLADGDPPVGELLPAAGMIVGIRSLLDGSAVALGEDDDGKPVYGVYSNGAGAFTVHVPPDLATTVLLTARFPGRTGAPDPRLEYDLLASAVAAETHVLDDDTALVARYARSAFTNQIFDFITTTDPDTTTRLLMKEWIGAPDALRVVMVGFVREVQQEAVKVGLDKAPQAEVRAVARRMTDIVLARIDLPRLMLTPSTSSIWQGPEEPAVAAMADVIKQVRVASAKRLAVDPKYFDSQPYFINANADQVPPYEIKKPSDLGDFLVDEYLAKHEFGSYRTLKTAMESFPMDPAQGDRLVAISTGMAQAFGQTLLSDKDGAKLAAISVVRAYPVVPEVARKPQD